MKITKGQMSRIVIMLLIAVVLVLSVWRYSTVFGGMMNPIENVEDFVLDATDFTKPTNFVINIVNGFFDFVTMMAISLGLFLVSLVVLLPWCLVVSIIKPTIAPVELKIAFATYIGVAVLSLVFGLIGASFRGILCAVILTLIVVIMFGLLCILPYWLVYRKCRKEDEMLE